MKKIAVILLLVIYSSSTVRATVHLHYCMNELVGWSLVHSDKDKKCGKCGMKEKKGGCCKDEHKQIKITADHQQKNFSVDFSNTFFLGAVPSFFNIPVVLISSIIEIYPTCHAPPDIVNTRLYILHCVYLI